MLTFVSKNYDGVVPDGGDAEGPISPNDDNDAEFVADINNLLQQYIDALESTELVVVVVDVSECMRRKMPSGGERVFIVRIVTGVVIRIVRMQGHFQPNLAEIWIGSRISHALPLLANTQTSTTAHPSFPLSSCTFGYSFSSFVRKQYKYTRK